MRDPLVEIACGSTAGAVGKLVEYPFDTTKVLLQTQDPAHPRFSGAVDCLIQTARSEGIRGLYRGVSSPLVGAAAEIATLFVSYDELDRLAAPAQLPPTANAIVCGAGAGVIASFVLTPIELIKCKMQVASMAGVAHLSVRRHIGSIWKESGIGGFWKGLVPTAIREAGGSAAWFGTYRGVLNFLGDDPGNENEPPSVSHSLIAGAASGVMYNISLFPADTVKSRMQTDSIMGRSPESFLVTLKSIFRSGGIPALYRGCGITCVRAAPSSALIFLTYEQLAGLWKSCFSEYS